jgi:hypothetical protein
VAWVREHFGLGPIVARSIEQVQATDAHDRTAWQQGVAEAVASFDRNRSGQGAAQTALGAGAGVIVGLATTPPVAARVAGAAATGLIVYWLVPTAWAVTGALLAPYSQRDRARRDLRNVGEQLASAQRGFAVKTKLLEMRSVLDTQVDRWQFESGSRGIGPPRAVADGDVRWLRDWLDSQAAEIRQMGYDELADELTTGEIPKDWPGMTNYAQQRVALMWNWRPPADVP